MITSIAGLGNTTAAKVLAYLGNVQRFKNAKALVAFVGVAPKALIVACMHKLLRQIYGVFKSRNAFEAHFLNNRLDFQDGI